MGRRDIQLGTLGSGEIVFAVEGDHFLPCNEVFLADALAEFDSEDRRKFSEVMPFTGIIGHTCVVETTDDDNIVFARRVGKSFPSRFVVGRPIEETDTLTVVLVRKQLTDGITRYRCVDYYFGPEVPTESQNKNCHDRQAAREFWANHAFVLGAVEIEPEDARAIARAVTEGGAA